MVGSDFVYNCKASRRCRSCRIVNCLVWFVYGCIPQIYKTELTDETYLFNVNVMKDALSVNKVLLRGILRIHPMVNHCI